MRNFVKMLAAVAAATALTTGAFAQSAKEIRGASPYVGIDNELAPKLIVDPPLPGGLALGVFWAQYRVENLRIVPVFGAGSLQSISTCRTSAHHRGRPALVVGGCK
jgi:hypothetical protein